MACPFLLTLGKVANFSVLYRGAECCFKIRRSLIIGEDVDAVFVMDFFGDNSALGEYMQAVQYGEVAVTEAEWRILCQD